MKFHQSPLADAKQPIKKREPIGSLWLIYGYVGVITDEILVNLDGFQFIWANITADDKCE